MLVACVPESYLIVALPLRVLATNSLPRSLSSLSRNLPLLHSKVIRELFGTGAPVSRYALAETSITEDTPMVIGDSGNDVRKIKNQGSNVGCFRNLYLNGFLICREYGIRDRRMISLHFSRNICSTRITAIIESGASYACAVCGNRGDNRTDSGLKIHGMSGDTKAFTIFDFHANL